MAVVQELLKKEENGTLSFGNYELDTKSKLQDFEYEGDLYKVKTFKEITKLEKNGMFVYESVPGTAVFNFVANDKKVSFDVEGKDDSQITLELEPEKEYKGTFNVRIQPLLHKQLVVFALKNGETLNSVVGKAIENYIG